jgi:hypothetical protein
VRQVASRLEEDIVAVVVGAVTRKHGAAMRNQGTADLQWRRVKSSWRGTVASKSGQREEVEWREAGQGVGEIPELAVGPSDARESGDTHVSTR